MSYQYRLQPEHYINSFPIKVNVDYTDGIPVLLDESPFAKSQQLLCSHFNRIGRESQKIEFELLIGCLFASRFWNAIFTRRLCAGNDMLSVASAPVSAHSACKKSEWRAFDKSAVSEYDNRRLRRLWYRVDNLLTMHLGLYLGLLLVSAILFHACLVR